MSTPKKPNENSLIENIANSISNLAKKNSWISSQKPDHPESSPQNQNNLQNSPLNRYWGKSK